jgi:hypothetical protein
VDQEEKRTSTERRTVVLLETLGLSMLVLVEVPLQSRLQAVVYDYVFQSRLTFAPKSSMSIVMFLGFCLAFAIFLSLRNYRPFTSSRSSCI